LEQEGNLTTRLDFVDESLVAENSEAEGGQIAKVGYVPTLPSTDPHRSTILGTGYFQFQVMVDGS
jgi:hypothetical protein